MQYYSMQPQTGGQLVIPQANGYSFVVKWS